MRCAGAVLVLVVTPLLTAADQALGPIMFSDVTASAGIKFKHNSGAFGNKYLPETMGSGCAFLDFDNDGWQDILLVNSMDWPGHRRGTSLPALYRNNRNGTFTDVTREAGLAVEAYGFGVAAADFDNDGQVDIYLTALGGNRLYRNLGGGRFSDVTAKAAVGASGFSTGAMWFDYDKDGHLDLFVARYIEWSEQKDLYCTLDGMHKSYCTPESYRGQSSILYRNRGDGTFEDASQRAGIANPASKALGVTMIDFDADGWPDVFVANDTQPNKLYRNNGNGTFTDVGVSAGVAFSEAGAARAGMGADAADYDHSGRPSLVIGNFSNEMMALYHNEGTGLFIDDAPASTIGQASLLTLTFGCFFFDYDLDGFLDIFAANGHVADDIERVQPRVRYSQPPHLFRNLGGRKFEDVGAKVGGALQQSRVARGAAYGDIDNDGDLDVLMTTNNGPAVLLRNNGGNRSRYLRIRMQGTRSNRSGIGAKVTVTLRNGTRSWSVVRTGSSYCSQSELPLTFGLGQSEVVARLEVAWPSGRVDVATNVPVNQTITVEEGKGIVLPEAASPKAPTPRPGS